MADTFSASLDLSEWEDGLERLAGPIRTSLARRMLVEGGVALRDEAKRWVKPSVGPYNPNSRGSQEAGQLRDAIYLAYDTDASTDVVFTYTVSWNAKKAWWGKLVEFGYYQRYVVYFNEKYGVFTTDKERKLSDPQWVPGKPFLRPAFDITRPKLASIMIARGQKELPLLLGESQ